MALAVNEREASQSGGIQTTMRNVGQAIGVALLGAVLLMGITNTVHADAAANPEISPSVSQQISSLNINLGSNEEFEDQISGIEMTDAERSELVQIEARARLDSTRIAYGVGAVIILLGLATTPWITTFKKDEGK